MARIKLSKQALAKCFPDALPAYMDAIIENVRTLEQAGILDNDRRIRHFLAQAAAETGGFTITEESGNYSAAGLRATFGRYFPTQAMAQAYAHKPQAIFNRVYADANRPKKSALGNTLPGDGYKYRGRGVFQITGKAAYREYGDKLGIDLASDPDKAADPEISIKIAVMYWTDRGLNAWADKDDILAISRAINGGNALRQIQPNGMRHRRSWYARTRKELPFTSAAEKLPPPIVGLKEGDEGDAVKSLQLRLRGHGYAPGNPDGIFGGATRRAVVAWQSDQRITPDGIWRPEYDVTLDASPDVVPEARKEATADDLRKAGDVPTQRLTWIQRALYFLGLGGLVYGQAAEQIPNAPQFVTQYQPVFEVMGPLVRFLSDNGPFLACLGAVVAAYFIGRVIRRLVVSYRRFAYHPEGGRE